MAELEVHKHCGHCNGTGDLAPEGEDVDECHVCEGLGRVISGFIDITEITDALEYIHGKVTAIWNQVKPPGE